MADILDIFANVTDLSEAIATLQVGIQEEDKLTLQVQDFHPDLQLLFTTIGMQLDTTVLTSTLTQKGTIYVSGPSIGKVAFKSAPDEVLVLQTPGFFTPLAKVREALTGDDQTWDEHTFVITLENDATCRVPVYTDFTTKEEREKFKGGQLIRNGLSHIKPVSFSYVESEPKIGFEPTTVDGVLALSNGKMGLGFVKVGSPFTQIKELPNGSYKVLSVSQEEATRKSDGNKFLSKKMQLQNTEGKVIETNAPRPISQLVRDAIPFVSADEGSYFYKIELVDGKITSTERDIKQIQKACMVKPAQDTGLIKDAHLLRNS